MDVIKIFTDGASRGNPGRGGYGAILIYGHHKKELSKGFRLTTNNRMEIMGVLAALQSLKKTDLPVVIYSDSQYVVNTIEKGWLKNWIKTDFKGGKKNKDLWLSFADLTRNLSIKLIWVKGHADNAYNNRCDELATAAADGKELNVDQGYEGGEKG